MYTFSRKMRVFIVVLMGVLLPLTALPTSSQAARLYDVTFLIKQEELKYMPVNYFVSVGDMYYRLDSNKAGSTKTEILFEYSKDDGATWHFLSRSYEDTDIWKIRFPNDRDASVIKVRTSVKFNPVVGKDTRSTIITGPYKVYHPLYPTQGVATPQQDGSINIAFRDQSNAEDYYRITRTGDGQTVTYRVPSRNDESSILVFNDTETNTRKSTKYTYYIEPVYETVLLYNQSGGLTLFAETKPSLLSNITRLSADQLQLPVDTKIKMPRYQGVTDGENEAEPEWLITIPVVLNLGEAGEAANEPTQDEINELNQLLDQTVASASPWARNEIKAAALLNLTTAEVLSNYQAPVNRAHFAGLLVKLHEKMNGAAAPDPTSDPFTDTDDEAVRQAYELGFVKGRTESTFDPYAEVTRQEIAVMLWRYAHLEGLFGLLPVSNYPAFADSQHIAPWAAEATDYMAGTGLLKGRGAGQFAPRSPMTREEAIVLIKRTYDAGLPFQ